MSFFCIFSLLLEINLNTLMIWSGVSLIAGVLILYLLLFSGKDYEPEPERIHLRNLVEDYRTRVTLHVENMHGVRKTLFQMKGLFQNNLFLLTHATVTASFLKQEMALIHLRYPLGGDLLLEFAEQHPNTFLVKRSKVFTYRDGNVPETQEYLYFSSEEHFLKAANALHQGCGVEGENPEKIQANKEHWEGLIGLFDHIEKIFGDEQFPGVMAISIEPEYVGVAFVFAGPHRFTLYPKFDKLKVDGLLELFDGMRGSQDETLEISRSELFAQSSLFRDLNENSDLLIMDEIDYDFFDRFPELKEETQHELEEELYSKETRRLQPNTEKYKKESPSEKEIVRETETTKIIIDPVIPKKSTEEDPNETKSLTRDLDSES